MVELGASRDEEEVVVRVVTLSGFELRSTLMHPPNIVEVATAIAAIIEKFFILDSVWISSNFV